MSRRGARVVEEARLESVYTSKAYHGFESRSLRKSRNKLLNFNNSGAFLFLYSPFYSPPPPKKNI